MRTDVRFDGLFESPGYWNLPILFASREEVILEYFNLWTVTRAESNLEELFDISILLLAATTPAPSYPSSEKTSASASTPHNTHFDFFLLHLLLSAHAIRILFKNLPYTTHNTMLEAQFLATISYYVSELRPQVKLDVIIDHKPVMETQDWTFIRRHCLEVDVTTECANGGNYIRGIFSLLFWLLTCSVEGVKRGRVGVWVQGWIVFEYGAYDCRTNEWANCGLK